ncbi:MAG: M23 family peptidase [Bacteroidetes bacterium]|nr:MAG: M23 family peptidase [Bacteroidota bacterium]
MTKENKKRGLIKRIFQNWNYKYKLVVMNEMTFEEHMTFRLSRMNILMLYVLFSIFSIALTIFMIYVTPLKEYIPGYASVEKVKQVYINQFRIDSLELEIRQRDLYLANFKHRILQGEDLGKKDTIMVSIKKDIDYKNIPDSRSYQDSILRKEWEKETDYDLVYYKDHHKSSGISRFVFFTPIHGTVINGFDSKKGHFGVDILGKKNTPIKSTLDGTVLFSGWTYENGYVIALQHGDNLISVYKHNSSLIRAEGDRVKAGDAIAIIGNTGKYTSGPHLHFELWYYRNPTNPVDFINFD